MAVTLGVMLLATVRLASAQSRERVAADLDVSAATLRRLIDLRRASSAHLTALATKAPPLGARAVLTGAAARPAAMTAIADGVRKELQADFVVIAPANDGASRVGGWRDPSGGGAAALRAAQTTAAAGTTTSAFIHDGERLYLVVATPLAAGRSAAGTLSAGFAVSDDTAVNLARLVGSDIALVMHGQVVATSLRALADANRHAVVQATTGAPGVSADGLTLSGRRYVAGAFMLAPHVPGGNDVQLLVLSDWAATQMFVDDLESRFALASVLALTLALVVGVYLSRYLSGPLREVAAAASQIAAGNLALELPVQGTAEAATVARAFNAMSVSLRSAHERLVHDAIHDHLTQLPNRAHFKRRLDQALARRSRRKDYQFAVLFVDLDRFKHINDSLGHTAGDRMLVMFADRLAAAIRVEDVVSRMPGAAAVPEPTLARFGGDEFAVLLDGIREPFDAVRVAKRVLQAAAEPLQIDGQDVFASASIGVAVAADRHRSGEDIVRDADLAMYRAKNAGANGYSVFDAALHEEAVLRLRLETDLRRAVERREFVVWYQPIVALEDHRVTGVEALVRWQHPEKGLVPPGEFFEVASEMGLVTQIDEWVVEAACIQGREWLRTGAFNRDHTISVNLSARAFAEESLVQKIADTLRATGYPATGLRLEVTEGTAIEDAPRTRVVLSKLRALGVRISLDDFGTGYSSLSYLQSLPLDVLKIDRAFVAGIGADKDKGEIVKLILGLGHTLKLEVVAEGIETAAQVDYLRKLGCQFGQGYFFATPAAPVNDRPPAVTPRVRTGAAATA